MVAQSSPLGLGGWAILLAGSLVFGDGRAVHRREHERAIEWFVDSHAAAFGARWSRASSSSPGKRLVRSSTALPLLPALVGGLAVGLVVAARDPLPDR